MALTYFERCTHICWMADAHIQTAADPLAAATEFWRDHPGFIGSVEVAVQDLSSGRPRLSVVLVRVDDLGEATVAQKPIVIYTMGACL
ncbi:MAG: hypothetical protein ACM3XM_19090 [Mycobacterium leprae]